MNPIVQLYWLRVALGIVAAALSALLATQLGASAATSYYTLVNCVSVALLVYLVSYYVLKPIFRKAIEEQSKIMTTGIGMYFFAWLSFLVLFYTLLR